MTPNNVYMTAMDVTRSRLYQLREWQEIRDNF